MSEILDDDGYTGYEADPLDDNYQVKCGHILVSATQKFFLRCAGCDLEYETLKDFMNHCIETHSFTDFEVDTKHKNNIRKDFVEENHEGNANSALTISASACEISQKQNIPSNSKYDDSNFNEEGLLGAALTEKKPFPKITLKPLEVLQRRDIVENDAKNRKRAYEQPECRFKCEYCDKSYPYSSSLSKHRKTFHTDITKYKCGLCDDRFTDEIYVIRHQKARHKEELASFQGDLIIPLEDIINSEHKDERNIDRMSMNKTFPRESLMDEMNNEEINKSNNQSIISNDFENSPNIFKDKIIRSPKVVYRCTMCPEEENVIFKSKKEWQAHENHAHLQPEKFKCKICNIGFPAKKLYQDHEQEMHQDLRPYKCPICFFAFKERKHLLRHERVHSGEKPFKCNQCTEQFTRKDCLNSHVLREHQNLQNDLILM